MADAETEAQQDFQMQIDQAIADGVNEIAALLLLDIEQHVAVRTGRLRDSYAIAQYATPEDPTAAVDSPVSYRVNHYPYTPEYFRRGGESGLLEDQNGNSLEQAASERLQRSLERTNDA